MFPGCRAKGLGIGHVFYQSAFLIVFSLVALALSSWMARYPQRTSVGILSGVALGFILLNVAAALAAFLANVLPTGQIDFWLANLIGSTQ